MLKLLDGKGLLIDAQLRGLTFSNQAFVVATSDVQQACSFLVEQHAAKIPEQISHCATLRIPPGHSNVIYPCDTLSLGFTEKSWI